MEGKASKKIPQISLILFLLLSLAACTQELALIQQEDIRVQTTDPASHQLGVLSDIHGDLHQLDLFLAKMKEEKVEGILVPGDLVLNEELRYNRPDQVEDLLELQTVLEHLGQAKIPVWVIPGNHERREIYEKAFQSASKNIQDLTQIRVGDLNGINLISLPGYYIEEQDSFRFLPEDGFFLSQQEIEKLPQLIAQFKDTDPILLITHGPPLSTLENSIDTLSNGEHTGSQTLREVLLQTNISIVVFGHIHEAGPQAENSTEKINEGQWVQRLWLNSGAVADGHATLLQINGKEISWIQLKE